MTAKDDTPVEGPGDGNPPASSAYRSGPPGDTPPPGLTPDRTATPGSSDDADAPEGSSLAENGGSETVVAEGAEAVEGDLDALLDDVKRERDEYLDLARRAKADFENFRKRAARDASEAEKRGKAGLARELLPSIDNLERALRASGVQPVRELGSSAADANHTSGDVSEEVSAREALARGVALVHSELEAGLARAGVESYDPAGEPFDPAVSEAISTAASKNVASGVVVETLERGYRLGGQVIRPARVIVSE